MAGWAAHLKPGERSRAADYAAHTGTAADHAAKVPRASSGDYLKIEHPLHRHVAGVMTFQFVSLCSPALQIAMADFGESSITQHPAKFQTIESTIVHQYLAMAPLNIPDEQTAGRDPVDTIVQAHQPALQRSERAHV